VPNSFTKTNAMIATVMKISTDMVLPMPRLRPRIRLLYASIETDEVSLAPAVRT
jgi:hypothetical protein